MANNYAGPVVAADLDSLKDDLKPLTSGNTAGKATWLATARVGYLYMDTQTGQLFANIGGVAVALADAKS